MIQSDLPTILTMGEPSGIGGEIAIKAWLAGHNELSPFCIIDSPARLKKISTSLKLNASITEISDIEKAAGVFNKSLPVLPIDLPEDAIPGELNTLNNQLTYIYDTKKERTGITTVLNLIKDEGLNLKDITTEKSSLESIFINLLKDANNR